MSEKRRDSKNRILKTGESQRSDGCYMYRYVDGNGKKKGLYSWRLVATDPIVEGRRPTSRPGNLRRKSGGILMTR